MRVIALLGAIFSLALAFAPTCAIEGCALHNPAPTPITPPYPDPTPFAGARDAGHE